jgi:hypothetical protein
MTPGAGNDILSQGDLGDSLSVSGQRSGPEGAQYAISLSSTDPIGSYSVDWGDGTTTSTLSHDYSFPAGPQAYTVTLTVTGTNGADGTCTVTLVQPDPPQLVADGPPILSEGTPCLLDLSASTGNGTISDWTINWGDGSSVESWTQGTGGWSNGSTSSEAGPSHTYTTGSGLYTVSVSGESVDGGGYAALNTIPVAVLPAVPTGLEAQLDGSTSVSLSWQPDPLPGTAVVEVSTDDTNWSLPSEFYYTDGPALPSDWGYSASNGSAGVNWLDTFTTYYFRVAAVNGAGQSAYCQGVECTTSGPWSSVHWGSTDVKGLGMAAYRTGGNCGTPVSAADVLSEDPSRYVILANDGYGDDPTGSLDNLAYHDQQVDKSGAITLNDPNLAKITLEQLPSGDSTGMVSVSVSGPARMYDSTGKPLGTGGCYTVQLGGTDPLADLASRSDDIYIEGTGADPDLVVTYAYSQDGFGWGPTAGAEVHMTVAQISAVGLNDNALSTIPCGEDLAEMSVDPSFLLENAAPVEYRTRVTALTSSEITGLTVNVPGGGGYSDTGALVGVGAGSCFAAESAQPVLFDDENSAAPTPQQIADIAGLTGARVLWAPTDGPIMTISMTTAEDDLTFQMAVKAAFRRAPVPSVMLRQRLDQVAKGAFLVTNGLDMKAQGSAAVETWANVENDVKAAASAPQVLALYGHANADTFTFGWASKSPGRDGTLSFLLAQAVKLDTPDASAVTLSANNATWIGGQIKALKDSGKLASNCIVVLYGCCSGLNYTDGGMPAELAVASGCTVFGTGGFPPFPPGCDIRTPLGQPNCDNLDVNATQGFKDSLTYWALHDDEKTLATCGNSQKNKWWAFVPSP